MASMQAETCSRIPDIIISIKVYIAVFGGWLYFIIDHRFTIDIETVNSLHKTSSHLRLYIKTIKPSNTVNSSNSV